MPALGLAPTIAPLVCMHAARSPFDAVMRECSHISAFQLRQLMILVRLYITFAIYSELMSVHLEEKPARKAMRSKSLRLLLPSRDSISSSKDEF